MGHCIRAKPRNRLYRHRRSGLCPFTQTLATVSPGPFSMTASSMGCREPSASTVTLSPRPWLGMLGRPGPLQPYKLVSACRVPGTLMRDAGQGRFCGRPHPAFPVVHALRDANNLEVTEYTRSHAGIKEHILIGQGTTCSSRVVSSHKSSFFRQQVQSRPVPLV